MSMQFVKLKYKKKHILTTFFQFMQLFNGEHRHFHFHISKNEK